MDTQQEQKKFEVDLYNDFFATQLITYIGNKRRLLKFINDALLNVKSALSKDKLTVFDGFSGSGATARLLKYYAEHLYVNDLENYAFVVNKCYLSNKSELDLEFLSQTINEFNSFAKNNLKTDGFIYKNYAPKDDNAIKSGERVFYTSHNAKMLDTLKELIFARIPAESRHLFLAPLIARASIHTNTSGIFKGFHKSNGVGCFGGKGKNSLSRILAPIELDMPMFSECECPVTCYKQDTNELIRELPEVDLAYYDPPYNQHPYGSNYFMLNILASEETEVEIQSGISGIAKAWNRSAYNKREAAISAFDDLLKNTSAKYILLSYNNEGIVAEETFNEILQKYGKVERFECDYNAYRGSRNLSARKKHVKELLWLVKKY